MRGYRLFLNSFFMNLLSLSGFVLMAGHLVLVFGGSLSLTVEQLNDFTRGPEYID